MDPASDPIAKAWESDMRDIADFRIVASDSPALPSALRRDAFYATTSAAQASPYVEAGEVRVWDVPEKLRLTLGDEVKPMYYVFSASRVPAREYACADVEAMKSLIREFRPGQVVRDYFLYDKTGAVRQGTMNERGKVEWGAYRGPVCIHEAMARR